MNKNTLNDNIINEIEALVRQLNDYNYSYHVLDSPKVTDETYDELFKHLKSLEELHGYVHPSSPTLRVGASPLEKFEMYNGKLFFEEEERIILLGLLLENVGIDKAITIGNPETWKNAIKELK